MEHVSQCRLAVQFPFRVASRRASQGELGYTIAMVTSTVGPVEVWISDKLTCVQRVTEYCHTHSSTTIHALQLIHAQLSASHAYSYTL